MQSTLTPTETDPHDIFVIEPDVVLAARADQTPAAPAVAPTGHPAPPRAAMAPDGAAAVSAPTVDTTFRATATTAAPAAADDIRAPEIEVPGDIHLLGKRPPRGRMARAILGFVFAIGAAAATAAWNHYGDTAKTMIANWTPFVLAPQPSQAVAKPAVAEQPSSADTPGSAQASATDQATPQSAPAAQPVAGTAPVAAVAAAPPPPSSAQDIAAMSQQIEALKASIEQLKAGQEQLTQQMAQQAAKANAARKLSTAAAQPVPPPAHKPRPAFSPAMAAAALGASRNPMPPPQVAYRPPPQTAYPPPQPAPTPYQPQAQMIDRADGDPLDRPPMPVR
jgi:hypothetical protein